MCLVCQKSIKGNKVPLFWPDITTTATSDEDFFRFSPSAETFITAIKIWKIAARIQGDIRLGQLWTRSDTFNYSRHGHRDCRTCLPPSISPSSCLPSLPRENIKRMLDQGLIRPSKSPWGACLLVFPKQEASGTKCLVEELWSFFTIPMCFSGTKGFYICDCSRSIWPNWTGGTPIATRFCIRIFPVALDGKDFMYSSFYVLCRTFEPLVMFFGLVTSPAEFVEQKFLMALL